MFVIWGKEKKKTYLNPLVILLSWKLKSTWPDTVLLWWHWSKSARHAFQASLRWHPVQAYAFLFLSKIFEICNMSQTICIVEAPNMCIAQCLFRWHLEKSCFFQAPSQGHKKTWKINVLPSISHIGHCLYHIC